MIHNPYQEFQDRLHRAYATDDKSWIGKNKFIFDQLRVQPDLALAGSIGMAVNSLQANRITDSAPNDIDIVTDSTCTAQQLLDVLEVKLIEFCDHTYWRRYGSHNTKFVCPPTFQHFRFESAFWLPVCIFVLPGGTLERWFTPEGYPIQIYEHVRGAAETMAEMRPAKTAQPDEDLPQDELDFSSGVDFPPSPYPTA